MVTWQTTTETDPASFNVVRFDHGRRVVLNPTPIPCQQCVGGVGASYQFTIGKHKSSVGLFVEMTIRVTNVTTSTPVTRLGF